MNYLCRLVLTPRFLFLRTTAYYQLIRSDSHTRTAFEPYKQVVPVSPSSAGNENTSAAMTPNTKAVITTELVPPMVVFVLCQVGV